MLGSIDVQGKRRSARVMQQRVPMDEPANARKFSPHKNSAQAKAQASPKAEAKAQTSAKAEAKAQTSARGQAQAQTSPKAQAKAQASPKAEAKAQTSAKAEAKAQTSPKAQAKAQAKAQSSQRVITSARQSNKLLKAAHTFMHNRNISKARSAPIAKNRYDDIIIDRQFKSMSFTRKNLLKPNALLAYRLQQYEYLHNNHKTVEFYLNIEKLLAKVEPAATGIVCLSKPLNIMIENKNKNNFRFAIKIAANKLIDSVKEIYILQQMIPFINKGYHNLPILYQSFQLNKRKAILGHLKKADVSDKIIEGFEDLFKQPSNKTNYNIYANEYANGDFKAFLKSYGSGTITSEEMENAVAQIIMSIATLHDIGIRHNDTHYGNFLYHEIQAGGYIKYNIQGQSYYVRNLGYLWVIWDFGISTQLNGKYDYFRDYEMLSLHLRKKNKKIFNMHFDVNDENKRTLRRYHGNLEFDRKMPQSVIKLETLLYEFSKVTEKDGTILDPAKSFEDENALSNAILKDPNIKALSQYYAIKTLEGKYLDNEAVFLTKYLIPIIPSIQQDIHVTKDQILFEITMNFIDIIRVDKNDKTDYDATVKKNHGTKIFLPRKFKT